jgi:hypothetical protein
VNIVIELIYGRLRYFFFAENVHFGLEKKSKRHILRMVEGFFQLLKRVLLVFGLYISVGVKIWPPLCYNDRKEGTHYEQDFCFAEN